MKCSICKKEIEKKYMTNLEGEEVMYWDEGNNAQPISDGRCCDACDCLIVIPARMSHLGIDGTAMGQMLLATRSGGEEE